MRRSYTISKSALLDLVEGIDPDLIARLLKKWGYKIKSRNPKEGNAELVQKHVGESISNKQLEELFLLREHHVNFRKREWKLFRLDKEVKRVSPKRLEKRLAYILKNEKLAGSTQCKVYDLGNRNLQYVSFIFKVRDSVFESWKNKFQIFKPVWKTVCILDYDHNVIRISTDSDNLKLIVNILGKAFGGDLKNIKLPPYILKELAEEDYVTRIVLFSSTEVSGTKGVGKIVLEGNDVMRGLEELRARQEIDLSKLGVLFEVGTESLKANVDGTIWAEDEKTMSLFLEKFIKSD